jgi:hypothetical protein
VSGFASVSDDELLASLPRGVRNRNPGNIEDGDFARSLPGYQGGDGRFAVFDSLDSGTAAQAKLLGSYSKRGINTVEGVVNRWAPPKENNTGAYVRFVSQKLGVDPKAPLDLNDERVTMALAEAMAEHENGVPVRAPDLSAVSDDELLASLGQAPKAAPAPQRIASSASGGVTIDRMPRQAPVQRVDQGLGFAKGLTHVGDRGAQGLEFMASKIGLDKPINALGEALGLPTTQEAAGSRQRFLADQAAKGVVPGKLGEFGGNVVGTLAVRGGPLVQGAVGGLLTGTATDAKGLVQEAAIGAVTSRLAAAGSDALQLGARKVLSKVPKTLDLPGLQAAKRELYKKAEQSGFTFAASKVRELADDFSAQVRGKGGPKAAQLIPASDAFAARLDALSRQKGGVKLSQLDALRSDIYDNLIQKGGAEAQQGYALRKAIDDLMDASDAPFIKAARIANTKYEKVAEVTARMQSAKLAAGRANSGENVVNATRQKLSPMIDPMHTGQVKNLTPDESSMIERIVAGDKVSNGLRNTSKLLRNKFVSGPLAVMTGAGAGPWSGLALMGALEGGGQLLRGKAEKYTQKQMQDLIRMMASDGSKQALAAVPTKASQAVETAIARILRPALVTSAVPALAAARPAPKTNKKK